MRTLGWFFALGLLCVACTDEQDLGENGENTGSGSSSSGTPSGGGGDDGSNHGSSSRGIVSVSSSSSGTGAGGSSTETNPVDVVESFTAESVSLNDTFPAILSITDIQGAAGCALSASVDAAPAADGHQFIVNIQDDLGRLCAAGVHPVAPDCGTDPFGPGNIKTCAQFRVWRDGEISERATAKSGSVTITALGSGSSTLCAMEFSFGFGGGVTFESAPISLYYKQGMISCEQVQN